jgi:hypothetical protein
MRATQPKVCTVLLPLLPSVPSLLIPRSSSLLLCLAMSALFCLAGGCGRGDGLTRYRVKGTVTYAGQPVEFGAIFFEPTASVGEIAPTVYLPVRGGKYDAGNEGPVAGKYVVRVGGQDQSKSHVDSDGIMHTAQLFQDYSFEVEIPPPNNTLDVEVPASQALAQP